MSFGDRAFVGRVVSILVAGWALEGAFLIDGIGLLSVFRVYIGSVRKISLNDNDKATKIMLLWKFGCDALTYIW